MPNKQQQKDSQVKKVEQLTQSLKKVAVSPILQKVQENHLSASHEKLLEYEQKNFEIQYATKQTNISKQTISEEMKTPLIPSSLKGQDIFQKYGSLIENQSIFLRQIIYKNYVNYLPSKFQNQFSQLIVIGSTFEVIWWGSLTLTLIKAFRNRTGQISLREKGIKGLTLGFVFLSASIGFHQYYYIPAMKQCFYRNIKTVDSLMDRHLNILKKCQQSKQGEAQQIKTIDKSKDSAAGLKK